MGNGVDEGAMGQWMEGEKDQGTTERANERSCGARNTYTAHI